MQKRHFEAIAAVLKACKPPTVEYSLFRNHPPRTPEQAAFIQWQQVKTAMANKFETLNPKFNRAKFYAACEGD
jgi:hypothetical protein